MSERVKNPGVAVGIDLGTTNSVVALHREGTTEVLVSAEGGRTIPSVFAITAGGERLVGRPAVDQEGMNPEHTVRSIKRRMGTDNRMCVGGREWSPEEISAEILKKIKSDAEAALGEPVTKAVITVPAYFDNNQREATKVAGELAGLEVLRIINEPTAAALAYGLDKRRNETVLVYDLGGGTFDVTILKISSIGVFEVKATAGDTRLGGDDFDAVLVERISNDIRAEATSGVRYDGDDPAYLGVDFDKATEARIREAAENLKKQFSSAAFAQISLPYIAFWQGRPVHFNKTYARADFNAAIAPLIARTKACVERALKDARMTATDIDEVVFVGGSTRVPAVAEAVEEWTGKSPNRSVNPDEAVGVGAAIQAAILDGAREKDVLLVDVTPLTLGVETLGGVMTPVIARNSVIPCEHTEPFTTAEDDQKFVAVRVFQGERPQVKDNRFLGEFKLDDLPPAPRGVPQIEVTFELDANGILAVRAMDKLSGAERKVTITGSSGLTSEDIARMLADAEAHAASDQAFRERTEAMELVHDKLRQVDELLRNSIPLLPASVVEELEDLQKSLESALKGENHLELLSSLSIAATETIQRASKYVYDKASESISPPNEGGHV